MSIGSMRQADVQEKSVHYSTALTHHSEQELVDKTETNQVFCGKGKDNLLPISCKRFFFH